MMASLTEDPGKKGKTYRIPFPQNQLSMPGVLELAVVGGRCGGVDRWRWRIG
jgi:hypothetical protein